jgi:hypothetical protein
MVMVITIVVFYFYLFLFCCCLYMGFTSGDLTVADDWVLEMEMGMLSSIYIYTCEVNIIIWFGELEGHFSEGCEKCLLRCRCLPCVRVHFSWWV